MYKHLKKYGSSVFVTLLLLVVTWTANAMDPRFELDPQTLAGSVSASKKTASKTAQPVHPRKGREVSRSEQGTIYTIKQGDHLFKILMRDYGLSNDEADSFIEEIRRENNIYDIKRLRIGQQIKIPPVHRFADGSLKLQKQQRQPERMAGHALQLAASPSAPLSELESLVRVRDVWDKIVPPRMDLQKPLSFQTATFSLTLDPQRYPSFQAMDGGRIVLDQGGTIPPLVKALIEEKDPTVHIVSETPAGTKHFVGSILKSGGFYSVEENFNLDFGADPKLTIHADFKVEKERDSLSKQDVVLIHSGQSSAPPALSAFLKNAGFTLHEPFAAYRQNDSRQSRSIRLVSTKKPSEIADAILETISIASDANRKLDVFLADNNGISLAVNADRYFERNGKRYVIARFDGDPVTYTLFRILETKGFQVVILEDRDDFRRVSEKIFSRLKIKANYAHHSLLQKGSSTYSLQMSGVKLDDVALTGNGVFLTDLTMAPIVRDILNENGFSISDN